MMARQYRTKIASRAHALASAPSVDAHVTYVTGVSCLCRCASGGANHPANFCRIQIDFSHVQEIAQPVSYCKASLPLHLVVHTAMSAALCAAAPWNMLIAASACVTTALRGVH